MRRYGSYIFDLDNTLVDSRKGYEEAFMVGFKEYGIPYDPALYNEYIRTPLNITFSKHYPNSSCKYRDFVALVFTTYDRTCLNGVELFPDAERCLERLSKEGCRLGVVSNSYMSQIEEILLALDIRGMFSSVVGRDSVAFPKPDPEPVILCLKEMGASPKDAMMVGDSVNDIRAGKGAGLFSVLINRHGEDIPCDECDVFIDSLDLL
jgi:HAD superfamily hydrolase (TIGR01509 family)